MKRTVQPESARRQTREVVLELLRRRYVREKQHAMRYRQHAERVDSQFHQALTGIAAEEEEHANRIAAKLTDLGAELPEIIPIHVAKEDSGWDYLRTDLKEEQRCAGELSDLATIRIEFPEVAELLERMDADSKDHRARLRLMMRCSVPQPLTPNCSLTTRS